MSMKTFAQHFTAYLDILWKIVGELSEDRQEWMRYKIGNSLLFGSASSFFFHMLAPKRNEASLNEALALRSAAIPFYGDNKERLAADIESIARYYSPKPPVEIDRKKKGRKVPKAVALRQEQIAERVAERNKTRERILPDLQGFLDGATYDPFELQPSEQAADRALMTATKAMESMQERVEQDILRCSENWQNADDADDSNAVARWETELYLAEIDEKLLQDRVKQYGFSSKS